MSHIFFEEEQRLTSMWWLWTIAIILAIAPLVILATQLPNIPDKDMNMLLISAFGFVPILSLIFFVRFQLRVNHEGIHYKFFPVQWNWKTIKMNEISHLDFQPTINFIDRYTIGHRLNRFTNTLRINITGKSFLLIHHRSGKKILIGSENIEGMKVALKRLTTRKEV